MVFGKARLGILLANSANYFLKDDLCVYYFDCDSEL